MAIRFNTAKQVALAGTGVASLTILDVYTGTQPASANDAASGTLLGTITGIAWDTAANPAVLDDAPYEGSAAESGTAGWGRFRNSDGSLRMDGAVGSEFTMADTSVVEGGTLRLTAASLTQPSGE
jgi:hypothetical protein